MKNGHNNKSMEGKGDNKGQTEKPAKPKKRKGVAFIKLNTALRGHDAGATLRIRVDNNGVPLDGYWRRRFKDAEHDNCVAFVG